MQKIVGLLKAHWLILVCASAMTLLVMSPIVAYPYLAGSSYKGFNIGSAIDEAFYIGRGKEILEGHNLGQLYFREGKDQESTQHSVIERIIISPLKWFGMESGESLVKAYYIEMAVGIFILMLLVYILVLRLSGGNKLLAAATAIFVVGGYHFIIYNKMKTQFSNFTLDLNKYLRPTWPIWSSVPFFVFLNLLVQSLKTKGWKYALWTGLMFGFLFYIYFFCWSFALILLGCVWLVALAKRDFETVKKVTVISGIGIVVGLYNLIAMLRYENSPLGSQTLFISKHRDFGHYYKISGLSVALTLLFTVFFFFRRKQDEHWPLFLSIVLASWVALNQQIITGMVLQDFHYSVYFIYPTTIIIGTYMVWSLLKIPRLRRLFLILLLVLAYIDTAARQYRGTWATLEIKNYAQLYRPVIDYLNKVDPTVVLFSDLYYSDLAIVYTPHDLLWSDMTYFYTFPIERLKDVVNVYYYMDKNGRKDFAAFVYGIRNKLRSSTRAVYPHAMYEFSSYTTPKVQQEAQGELALVDWSYLYAPYRYLEGYRYIFQSPAHKDKPTLYQLENIVTEENRKELITELAKQFHEVAAKPSNVVDILKKYHVEYIVWDSKRQPTWDVSVLPGLKEVLVSGSIHVYQLSY